MTSSQPKKDGKKRHFDGRTNRPYSNNVQNISQNWATENPRLRNKTSKCQNTKKKSSWLLNYNIERNKTRAVIHRGGQSSSMQPRSGSHISFLWKERLDDHAREASMIRNQCCAPAFPYQSALYFDPAIGAIRCEVTMITTTCRPNIEQEFSELSHPTRAISRIRDYAP